ncbi:hypothetical protein FOFC_02940 [Fusarium oxysporum]|nr:hypothetical protein FOFC_02940 [Fusarium oxysporum]
MARIIDRHCRTIRKKSFALVLIYINPHEIGEIGLKTCY